MLDLLGVAFARTGREDETSAQRSSAKTTPYSPWHVPPQISVDQLPGWCLRHRRLLEAFGELSRLQVGCGFSTHHVVLRRENLLLDCWFSVTAQFSGCLKRDASILLQFAATGSRSHENPTLNSS
jgi:hypothetical protein